MPPATAEIHADNGCGCGVLLQETPQARDEPEGDCPSQQHTALALLGVIGQDHKLAACLLSRHRLILLHPAQLLALADRAHRGAGATVPLAATTANSKA
jgi:hypothetical protein